VSNHKGVGFWKALPYALATFFGAVAIAYACLKLYDEPVRSWLQRRWMRPAEKKQKMAA
jgi:peptidoglycan/LPS O-acetylase OafA/YrhL